MDVNLLSEKEIIAKLASLPSEKPANHYPEGLLKGEARPAAVLIPLIEQPDGWHVLYIRRSEIDGDTHSGQVAFPGGAKEARDETLEMAALREAQEEIGVAPQDVRILGKLNDFLTISNYLVRPFVGVIPWPYKLVLSPGEVSRAFTIPLGWLADRANREIVEREAPELSHTFSVIYFSNYDEEILWGASAQFTIAFLESLNLA